MEEGGDKAKKAHTGPWFYRAQCLSVCRSDTISSLRSWQRCTPPPRHWLDWFEAITHVFLYWFPHVKVNYCSCCRRINHHNLWLAAAVVDILRVSLRKFLLKRPAIHPLASLKLILFAVNISSNQNINVFFVFFFNEFILSLCNAPAEMEQLWWNTAPNRPAALKTTALTFCNLTSSQYIKNVYMHPNIPWFFPNIYISYT